MSWKRLESASVAADLAEGLEARIADPLWMLARQWQTGEFKGDDAANPLLMRVEAQSVRVERLLLPGGRAVELDEANSPLEPLVECEPVREGPSRARVAIDLGRLLVRALQDAGAPRQLLPRLAERFAVDLPPDDRLDPVGRRRMELLARGAIDGVELSRVLEAEPTLIEDVLVELGVNEAARDRVDRAVTRWRQATAGLFTEPDGTGAWDPRRMEYRFELEATGRDGERIRLDTAEGYTGGRLDWYAFDRVEASTPPSEPGPVIVRRAEVLPAPLRFRGMPASRFWELEEGDVYLGGIDAAPEDLARVAVAGYATVHGDDWFLLPIRVPVGSLTEITRVTVLDDFGRRTDVPAAAVVDGRGAGRAFKFFELTGDPNPGQGKAPLLFLPPTVETTDAGRPLEDVRFLRDETANLAWAVEERIESAAGRPVDVAARRQGPAAAESADAADDAWRLVLSTPVPDSWIPLVPVRLASGDGEKPGPTEGAIMFQRGRKPAAGGAGRTLGALGHILEPWRRLLLHEEEVPRAGIRVVRRFQSARDAEGRLHTWVGRRKGPGRGEGSSGLAFDVLERPPVDRTGDTMDVVPRRLR